MRSSERNRRPLPSQLSRPCKGRMMLYIYCSRLEMRHSFLFSAAPRELVFPFHCPFRAKWFLGLPTQGVASLALGYDTMPLQGEGIHVESRPRAYMQHPCKYLTLQTLPFLLSPSAFSARTRCPQLRVPDLLVRSPILPFLTPHNISFQTA